MPLLDKLIAANPWVRDVQAKLQSLRPAELTALAAPFAPESLRPVVQARRAFHEALSALGTPAWNAWSEAVLRLRPATLGQASEAAMLWRAIAFVDLSHSQFLGTTDWSGRVFPADFCASQSRFAGDVHLTGLRVKGDLAMQSVAFERDCWMDSWIVEGSARFRLTSWVGRVEARGSRFSGMFDGRETHFARDCWFTGSTIGGRADFTDARFASDAGFGRCCFARDAVFDSVSFDDTVGMEECVFAGSLSFHKTAFATRLFLNRASFAREPMIDRAEFAIAPNLTGACFPAPTGQTRSSLRDVRARH